MMSWMLAMDLKQVIFMILKKHPSVLSFFRLNIFVSTPQRKMNFKEVTGVAQSHSGV